MGKNNPISEYDKKLMLSSAVWKLTKEKQFYGNLLQELAIKFAPIQTLGITYNKKLGQYEILVDPNYFAKVSLDNRVALCEHEIQHFTHKHLFRFPFLKDTTSQEDRHLYNVAGDMSINQYIQNLPDGCDACRGQRVTSREMHEKLHPSPELLEACPGKGINVTDWICDDGTPFPKLAAMETYYELIKKELEKQTGKDGKPKPQEGSDEAKSMNDGKGPQKPGDTTKGTVASNLAGGAKPIDEHEWDSLDEETKKKMLDEAKKLIKRSMEKTSSSYTKIPDEVKDLLQEIDTLAAGLNYKELLRSVIKKTVSCVDRETTWKKPNKRYGAVAPGSKIGVMPHCSFYVDTSGSISIIELNEFLKVMSGFLKVGSRNCWLGLWHTNLYYKKKYKLNAQLDKSQVQSGGTDVESALQDIKRTNPNLSIILTDGCFDTVDIKIPGEVLWIISKNGNKNHPLTHIGKTIMMEDLK